MTARATLDEEAERVLARRSAAMVRWFGLVFRRALRRDFHALRMARGGARPDPAGAPLVIYSNHPSWWDPIVLSQIVGHLLPGRHAFAPIEAAMLKRYRFFGRVGLFGVDPGDRRSVRLFAALARAVLRDPRRLLVVTAQGRFADPRERPLRLKPGLAHIAHWAPEAHFLPLALDYAFWDERKPEALVRFGPAVAGASLQALSMGERAAILERALEAAMDALRADALSRDPARFDTVVSGAAGVGGLYDAWRAARAWTRGERFSAAHGDGG